MKYFSTRAYYDYFKDENSWVNWGKESDFRKPIFKEWLATLKVGDKLEVLRPNGTRGNNSSPYYNQGICEVIEIREDTVVFKKGVSKKLYYRLFDFTVETNRFCYEKAKELLIKELAQ